MKSYGYTKTMDLHKETWRECVIRQFAGYVGFPPNILLNICGGAIQVMSGNDRPRVQCGRLESGEHDTIIVGADWLKENLTREQFAKYVADRMNGFEKGR